MPIPIIVLLIVLIGIATRKLISNKLSIWMIMCMGGIAVLITDQITLRSAIQSINMDVMLFLFGVFVIAQAAESSGYLELLAERLFTRAKTGKLALLVIIFIIGPSAALLMNDTSAIIGTIIILQLCKKHRSLSKPLLLALAYSVTIGSVLSPIGNPQNLLISLDSNLASPFLNFFKYLWQPTLINLVITFFMITLFYRQTLKTTINKIQKPDVVCQGTIRVVKLALIIFICLIVLKIIFSIINYQVQYFQFCLIALLAASPIILFSKKRFSIIKNIDWGTLLFFISMFILIQSVWDCGLLQKIIKESHINVANVPTILTISTILSQFISNVPLVALYLPILDTVGVHTTQYMALAAGSTIAGNLFIIGAASTIIIIQNVERRKFEVFSFFEFAKIGIPLTIINLIIYYLFL